MNLLETRPYQKLKLPKISKYFSLLTLFLVLYIAIPNKVKSCDVCGCSTGGLYQGILPQFNKNLIGLRQGYSKYNHPSTLLNYNGDAKVLHDNYYSTELWTRIYLHPKLQLMAFLPYKVNQRVDENETIALQGLGDIKLNLNYMLFNTASDTGTIWKNALLLGAIVKLPTGNFNARTTQHLLFPNNFQLGTGGTAVGINAMYTLRKENFGLNTVGQYVVNFANVNSYRVGNQTAITSEAFYWNINSKTRFLYHVGATFEHAAQEYSFEKAVENTGGNTMLATGGVDFYTSNLMLSIVMQLPILQQTTAAQPTNSYRTLLNIGYFFGRDK